MTSRLQGGHLKSGIRVAEIPFLRVGSGLPGGKFTKIASRLPGGHFTKIASGLPGVHFTKIASGLPGGHFKGDITVARRSF